jgi:hypothetical protein
VGSGLGGTHPLGVGTSGNSNLTGTNEPLIIGVFRMVRNGMASVSEFVVFIGVGYGESFFGPLVEIIPPPEPTSNAGELGRLVGIAIGQVQGYIELISGLSMVGGAIGAEAATAGGASPIAVPVAIRGACWSLHGTWMIFGSQYAMNRRPPQEHAEGASGSGSAPTKQLTPDQIAKRMGATAESKGWKEALAGGQKGIAGPKRKNVNTGGFDYATFDPTSGKIKIYDAKYRKDRSYPNAVSAAKQERWKAELRDFLENEYEGADKQSLLQKLNEGKVEFEVYGWPR